MMQAVRAMAEKDAKGELDATPAITAEVLDKIIKAGTGVNALKTVTESAKSTLTACRTIEASENPTQQNECNDFTSYVSSELQNSKPDCVCSLPKTPSDSVLKCVEDTAAWGTTHSAKYPQMDGTCKTGTSDLKKKKEEC